MEQNKSLQNTNIFDRLKEPGASKMAAISISIVILIFVILTFILIFNKGSIPDVDSSGTTQEQQLKITSNVFIMLFLSIILIGAVVLLLPNFENIKGFIGQIKDVFWVVIYTILFIFLFRYLSEERKESLDKYAKYIVPLSFVLTSFMFYKGFSQNYVEQFNLAYERIKNIILLFCFITIMIVYYDVDPGGLISENFGYTLLLTIITSVFGLLYLLIIFAMPKFGQNIVSIQKPQINSFAFYGSILYAIFAILFMLSLYYFPGIKIDTYTYAISMIMFVLTTIIWVTSIMISLYVNEPSLKTVDMTQFDLAQKSLMYLFGFILSGLIIGWLTYNLENLSSDSTIISFVLNLLLVIIVLMLVYRTINARFPQGNTKKNAFFEMIINLLFYIPCLFSTIFDYLFTNIKEGASKATQESAQDKGSLKLLIIAIGLIASLFILPKLNKKVAIQGGNQLVNEPVNINTQHNLSSYEELNGSIDPDYQYAISFWLYIDSASPNTSPAYSKYTSVLNFGGKPNILYKADTNSLMITMTQQQLREKGNNKLIEFDENGNRIIYIDNNFPLQKWNHIIVNYNGGTLDVFMNKKLVKSSIGVIPYISNDILTIGSEKGINGGICNLVYYTKPLTNNQIYIVYNMVKGKNPPVPENNFKQIITNNYK
jgi:hypothetical protein